LGATEVAAARDSSGLLTAALAVQTDARPQNPKIPMKLDFNQVASWRRLA
jgi:hypothetical protein